MDAKACAQQQPTTKILDEIQEVVGRANQGDETAVPRLCEYLANYPQMWTPCGDLAAQAKAAWLKLAAGSDLILRECLRRKAETLGAELAGPVSSPMERLLVERVVACWLQLLYLEALEARASAEGETPRGGLYRAKRQEQAQRMYLAALNALAMYRKLLAKAAAPAAREAGANGKANAGPSRENPTPQSRATPSGSKPR